jgi:hypothetical protein
MLSAASQRGYCARFFGGFLSLPAIRLAPLIPNEMPQRDFVIWLDGGMYIAVDFTTSGPTSTLLPATTLLTALRTETW